MAELNTDSGGGNHGGKKRAKKQSTKVDMTPLVDLAFLLLTFFVLTSTFSQPKTMRMIFPEKIKDPTKQNQPAVKDGHTILISKNNEIYYYRGELLPTTELVLTNLSSKGLRTFLVGANKKLIAKLNEIELRKNKNKLDKLNPKDTAKLNAFEREFDEAKKADKQIVIIKNDDGATYKNMIDVIDELAISNIIYYYPTEDGFTPEEVKRIAKLKTSPK